MIANQPSVRLAHAGSLATESPLRDLEAIIRSRTPLIAVESNEEPQIVSMVRQIATRLQLKAFRWTVTEGLRAHGLGDRSQRLRQARAALEEVGLEASMLERYPHEFSGGQRQRVAIARALVLRPRLMILDEPTSALDKPVQFQVVELLGRLGQTRNVTYIFITHDLSLVRALCHDVLVIHNGRAVEQGTVDSVFASPRKEYTQRLLAAAL